MNEALLDTDILSEVLKRKDKRVLAAARQYLVVHQWFAFWAITAYVVIRGLRANRARRQLAEFLKTMGTSGVFPVSRPAACRRTLGRRSRRWPPAR